MKALWNSAIGLLLVNGTLLGLTLPFGKMAAAAGVPPAVWAFVISCGAGAVLLSALLMHGGGFRLNQHRLRYFTIVAAVSYAIPNLLLFAAIPHLGVGFSGIMFTISPLFTLAFSLMLRLQRPNLLGTAGIGVGFLGALLVALTRGEASQPAEPIWVAAGLLIPVSLAIGNVYRTLDWPEGSGPIQLAAGSHLSAAVMLLVAAMAGTGGAPFAPLVQVPWLVVAQVIVSSAMFAVFFRLQAVGGPVYLSQIGYVAAAIGLVSGMFFLGESYRPETWLGAVLISIGLVMTTRAQLRQAA
ncbi:EamA-like transporter family protein [Pseudaminobacter salicylatoxidans]|uniref:EamA-like transporter family protein n=1 Tax=Pseudaminobacter salicylatoxidans TaxID=93369 RepID=A0A316C4Q1_PSESE|nr:DMT family transporter [Pseudaminobacter salicylatoxidans]PWJ84762.1 EamA-like transporter family protein [Pseudaminobacter salicylatoxidans]